MVNLERLIINGSNSQDTDIRPLANLKKLHTLTLSDCRLTDVSVLAGLKNLRSISLYNNPGLSKVSTLAALTNLESLDLRQNPDLSKAEIDSLQQSLPRCKITHDTQK